MKKLEKILFAFFAIAIIFGNGSLTAADKKHPGEETILQEAIVKKSVESGRFIIRLNRIYFRRGGIADLRPRANYIILDRGNALINTAYVGRQFDIRPILGINMTGKANVSEIKNISGKGKYLIKMKVDNGKQVLNVTLRILKDGSCDAAISGLMIDNITYSGDLVPVKDNVETPPPTGVSI